MGIPQEIGGLLAAAREDEHLTQKQVAEKLGVNQSWVSRLESGIGEPQLSDYQAFLKALRGDQAKRARRLLTIDWKHLPRPSFNHPDIDVLIEAELALRAAAGIRQRRKSPARTCRSGGATIEPVAFARRLSAQHHAYGSVFR